MKNYYKPKEKKERTEEQVARHAKLFFDKRVRNILTCDCGNPMTATEARRNGGVCDECTK